MAFSWKDQPRPIVALSPMADMTDSPFCRVAKRFGAKIVFREMVSAEAIVRGSAKTLQMAAFHPEERPIVQQIFGKDPSVMAEATRIVYETHQPDAIDVNMGCPVYKITSDFNGAALMKEPERAEEIIRQMVASVPVPVSVKIRLGWSNPDEAKDFAPQLEQAGAALLTVHGRTRAQGYSGVSDWARIGEVKQRVSIPLLANGDIHQPEAAVEALRVSGADGVLVARGALGNPWRMAQMEEMLRFGEVRTVIDEATRRRTILEHFDLMAEENALRLGSGQGEAQAAILMRKHLSWYYKGAHGAKELRSRLVRITSRADLLAALNGMVIAV
ncbi:MAG: tRNA dihydrouridine synthase DusB [Patescibacteria group bacterium]